MVTPANLFMATVPSAPTEPSVRLKHSCTECHARKVKCDRQQPCDKCIRRNVSCTFLDEGPRKRNRRARHDNMIQRLDRLESALREQGIDRPEVLREILGPGYREDSARTQPLTPASIDAEPQLSGTNTQLAQGPHLGRSVFVDNILWSRVVQEINEADEALEEVSSDDGSDTDASEEDGAFVLSRTKVDRRRHRPHPSPQRILRLWDIFIHNVDPLTKIVHVPTMQPAVEMAASNIDSVPKNFEALLLAIYSAAILSLKESECRQLFGESRRELMSQYTSATRSALSRAAFMRTNDIVILQALMLYLISVREFYDPRTVWTLTGIAIRIAEGMGLHRDGASLGLSPFDSEIRRRIWWQLKMHDFRNAELCGIAKFQGIETHVDAPQQTANVNDDALYPSMTSAPVDAVGATDMIFCMLRSQMGSFAARYATRLFSNHTDENSWSGNIAHDDAKARDSLVEEIKNIMETNYLRFCDPSQPLELFTLLFARFSINTGYFMAHHPRHWASIDQPPESEQQFVWNISLKLLELYNMMQSDRRLSHLAWHAAYYTQWHAFIHVLDTLRAKPLLKDATRAWQLIQDTYENNPSMLCNPKRPIHVAVGNLCLKAFNMRETSLKQDPTTVHATPQFIIQLRREREAVRAARQERAAKLDSSMNKSSTDRLQRGCWEVRTSETESGGQGSGARAPTQHDLAPQPKSIYDRSSNTPHDKRFPWFGNGNEVNAAGLMSDGLNMDIDFMLAQDQSLDNNDPNGQAVDWTQWDAWLTDPGMTLGDAEFDMGLDSSFS